MSAEPEYYKDENNQWRWRVKSRNGKVIDASSESFLSKQAVKYNYGLNHEVERQHD